MINKKVAVVFMILIVLLIFIGRDMFAYYYDLTINIEGEGTVKQIWLFWK